MGDAFLGKSGTTATLAAESVAEGGCIIGLLAASAAMVARISANCQSNMGEDISRAVLSLVTTTTIGIRVICVAYVQ